MAITSRLVGKFGGGFEVQEWYYNHPSGGTIPTDKQNPVIAKVEEATPEEPVLVVIEANMRDMQNYNSPWVQMVGGASSIGAFYNGKWKHAFFATRPGELRLTNFNGYMGAGLHHTRAYITRLSDYVPL